MLPDGSPNAAGSVVDSVPAVVARDVVGPAVPKRFVPVAA